jgi:peroxiredoxin
VQRTPREGEDQKPLPFTLLRDQGNQVAGKFGLVFTLPETLREVYRGFGLDLAKANNDPSWTLPIPARLVIDPQGVVRAVDADPDYTRRPEPAETLRALRALDRRAS